MGDVGSDVLVVGLVDVGSDVDEVEDGAVVVGSEVVLVGSVVEVGEVLVGSDVVEVDGSVVGVVGSDVLEVLVDVGSDVEELLELVLEGSVLDEDEVGAVVVVELVDVGLVEVEVGLHTLTVKYTDFCTCIPVSWYVNVCTPGLNWPEGNSSLRLPNPPPGGS